MWTPISARSEARLEEIDSRVSRSSQFGALEPMALPVCRVVEVVAALSLSHALKLLHKILGLLRIDQRINRSVKNENGRHFRPVRFERTRGTKEVDDALESSAEWRVHRQAQRQMPAKRETQD